MAVEGCGLVCKYIIILFDCILAVLGLIFAGFGLWLRFSNSSRGFFEIENLNTSAFAIGVTVMIVLGAVILIVVSFGDFGACSENRVSLQVFSCLVAILAGADAVIGVLAYQYHDVVAGRISEFYTRLYFLYKNTVDPVMGMALRFLHYWVHCCGITGLTIEDVNDDICPDARTFWENVKMPNCPQEIATYFDTRAPFVVGVFLGTGALLITVLICSIVLLKHLKRSRDEINAYYSKVY